MWPKQPVLKVAELIEWMSAPPNSCEYLSYSNSMFTSQGSDSLFSFPVRISHDNNESDPWLGIMLE